MSSTEPIPGPRRASVASGWSLAGRLTLWYAASAFLLVAVATGALYWALVTNAERQDDQLLVDTVQILRALLQERPGDTGALRQELALRSHVQTWSQGA